MEQENGGILIPVKLLASDISRFLLRDTLRRLAPLLIGLGVCVGAMLYFHFTLPAGSPFLKVALFSAFAVVVAVWFINATAKRQAAEAQRRKPITAWVIGETGVTVLRGDQEQRTEYDQISAARVVSGYVALYRKNPRRAMLLPLRDLSALEPRERKAAVALLQKNLPRLAKLS